MYAQLHQKIDHLGGLVHAHRWKSTCGRRASLTGWCGSMATSCSTAFHKQIDVYTSDGKRGSTCTSTGNAPAERSIKQDRLIEWLQAAIHSATPGTTSPIPERPKFENERPPAKITPNGPTETAKPPAAPGGSSRRQNPCKNGRAEPAKPQAAPGGSEPPAKPASNGPAEPAKPPEPTKPPTPEKPKADGEKPPAKAVPKPSVETQKPQAASVSGKSLKAQPPAKARPSPDADKELAKRAPRRAVEPPLVSPEPAATLPEPNAAAADLRCGGMRLAKRRSVRSKRLTP